MKYDLNRHIYGITEVIVGIFIKQKQSCPTVRLLGDYKVVARLQKSKCMPSTLSITSSMSIIVSR